MHAAIWPWIQSRTRWDRVAILIWIAVLLFISVRVLFTPYAKTVYPMYSGPARLWWQGAEMYEPHCSPEGIGYRYSPTFAILMTPFAHLPDGIGGVLWRIVSAVALLASLRWFARRVLPDSLDADGRAWLLLLTLPLCLQSIDNGQANLLVVAALLGAVAAVQVRRWNVASLLLALTFLCKLYPVCVGFVIVLFYPRQLAWRLALAMIGALALPFLFQEPSYVLVQYRHWLDCLRLDNREAVPLNHMCRDLWLLIHLYGLPIPRGVYMLAQALGGIAVAAICWMRWRAGWPERAILTSTLALVAVWMMLLGPATESASYALLAPSFAWALVESLSARNPRHGLLWISALVFAVAVASGVTLETVRLHYYGIHVYGAIFYAIYLLTEPRPSSLSSEVGDDAVR